MIEISPKEYEKYMNWYDGMLYCQLLEIDGKCDWRLPTIEELDYIYKNIKNDFEKFFYFSCSGQGNQVSCYYFSLSGKNVIQSSPKHHARYYIRAIRDI